MIASIVSAVFGFALVMVFTRVLTPEEYGIYVVGVGVATLLSSLLFNWIKTSLLRFSSEGEDVDMRLTAIISFGVIAAISPVAFGVFVQFSGDTPNYMLGALCVAIGVGLFEFTLEIFRARQRTGLYAVSTIVRSALAFCIALILVLGLDLGGQGLLFGVAGGYFATLLIFMPKIWKRPIHKFDAEILKKMLRFGLPMTLSGAAFTIHAFVDRLVIVTFLGEASAGVYGAAADFVRQIIMMLGVAIGSAVLPIAIRLFAQNDRAATDRHLAKSFELLMALILPSVVGMALTAEQLAAFVLGEEFRAAASMLIPILVFAWLFRSVSYQYIHVSFQLAEKPALMGVQGLFILTVNVACMAVLVPPYGLSGAAYSLVIAEIGGVAFGFFLCARAYPLPIIIWPVLKICLATAIMAVTTVFALNAYQANDFVGVLFPVITGATTFGLAAILLDIAGIRGIIANRLRTA